MNEARHLSFGGSALNAEISLVDAVERSPLRVEPFDHIYMENVLKPAEYASLLAAIPAREHYHELRHSDALRNDGSSTRLRMYLYPELLRRLPKAQRKVWTPIAKALCSDSLQNAFKHKFKSVLEERFAKPISRVSLYPVPILLRDMPGYRIGVHSDVSAKAITVQFYLPKDAAQRNIGTIFHKGENGPELENTTQMPFLPASGYAFPVSSSKSWHSAATTTEDDGERVSMMVTYYVAESLWTKIKFRIRRAGLMVGLHPRG